MQISSRGDVAGNRPSARRDTVAAVHLQVTLDRAHGRARPRQGARAVVVGIYPDVYAHAHDRVRRRQVAAHNHAVVTTEADADPCGQRPVHDHRVPGSHEGGQRGGPSHSSSRHRAIHTGIECHDDPGIRIDRSQLDRVGACLTVDSQPRQARGRVRIVDVDRVVSSPRVDDQLRLVRQLDRLECVNSHPDEAVAGGRAIVDIDRVGHVRRLDGERVCRHGVDDGFETRERDGLGDRAIGRSDRALASAWPDHVGSGEADAASARQHQAIAAEAAVVLDPTRGGEEGVGRVVDGERVVAAKTVESERSETVEDDVQPSVDGAGARSEAGSREDDRVGASRAGDGRRAARVGDGDLLHLGVVHRLSPNGLDRGRRDRYGQAGSVEVHRVGCRVGIAIDVDLERRRRRHTDRVVASPGVEGRAGQPRGRFGRDDGDRVCQIRAGQSRVHDQVGLVRELDRLEGVDHHT